MFKTCYLCLHTTAIVREFEKKAFIINYGLYGCSWKGISSRFASNGDVNSPGSLKPHQIEKKRNFIWKHRLNCLSEKFKSR